MINNTFYVLFDKALLGKTERIMNAREDANTYTSLFIQLIGCPYLFEVCMYICMFQSTFSR